MNIIFAVPKLRVKEKGLIKIWEKQVLWINE